MSTIQLDPEEINILKDSLSNERLSIREEEARNPELSKYLEILEALEKKLATN